MGGIVVLEDGSDISASGLGLDGALTLIAEAIADKDAKLAAWLSDVAGRPAPFQDFDLRQLCSDRRAVFWLGVERAYERCADWDQDASYSWAVDAVRRFYSKRDVRGTLVEAKMPTTDLEELWDTD